MGLLERAKADIEAFTSNTTSGWGTLITFQAPTGEIATIGGIHSKHHLAVDGEGNMVNSKKAHVSVSENLLVAAGYPVRNAAQEVALVNHRVSVKDSTTITKEYVVMSVFPDETVGLIVCILRDFQ